LGSKVLRGGRLGRVMDKNEAHKERTHEHKEEEEEKKSTRTDSMLVSTVRVNGRFQEYMDGLGIAEDVLQIYKAFDLGIHTMMLAVSIVHRVLIQAMRVNDESNNQDNNSLFKCLRPFGISLKN